MSHREHQAILLIGAGNMGASIAKGLIANHWPAELITFCEQQTERHAALMHDFPQCNIIAAVTDITHTPDVILLAVKPHDMAQVCRSLSHHETLNNALFISVAAGLPISCYQAWLGRSATIVRCMPNTPAAIGLAMTGLYTADNTSQDDKQLADQILNAIGKTLWVNKESMLDAVTAVSGSGPAYLFYLMECMQNSGQALGLSSEESYALTLQTMLGAAQLAAHQGAEFGTLRANVTSKGGTTEQAINCFMKNKLQDIVDQALTAAADRAQEISQSFDKE